MRLFSGLAPQTLMAEARQMAITCAIALATGWVFLQIGLPAPYLMGSLFGLWIFGGLCKPARPYLGIAKWLHVPVILGMGVLIGANFTRQTLAQASAWQSTVIAMIGITFLVSLLAYWFLHKGCGFEKKLAFLCCIPGGQVEAIALARDLVDKDYVVALFHLVRVVIVLVSTPLLLAVTEGQQAVDASNITLQQMPGLEQMTASQIAVFAAVAIGGYFLARLGRVPIPHLLGPMGLSTLLHMAGVIELPRIQEFVLLAQLVIGGGIGVKLAKVAFREVLGYLKLASGTALLILASYLLVALLIAQIGDMPFLRVWLAFVPGGLYEVTLLALIFGLDVAFVAFHHTLRIVMIFLSMPVVIGRLRR